LRARTARLWRSICSPDACGTPVVVDIPPAPHFSLSLEHLPSSFPVHPERASFLNRSSFQSASSLWHAKKHLFQKEKKSGSAAQSEEAHLSELRDSRERIWEREEVIAEERNLATLSV
jgi:hypothetical protein